MIQFIPSQTTKKWLTSFRGDFWGNLINMFSLDLFSAQGKARVGTKYYPHTLNITPPSAFVESEIYDGVSYPKKVWAVSGTRKVYRSKNNGMDQFELDTATGIPTTDDTGSWSDLVSVPDESEDSIVVTEISIPAGDGAVSITGSGNNVKWAQSFTQVQGPFKSLSLYLKKVGTPTDDITFDIQSDNAGNPSGTSITKITVTAEQFTTSFVSHTFEAVDFTDSTVQFGLDQVYHLVLSRSGSADTDNYVMAQIAFAVNDPDTDDDSENPYKHGELQNYNGSAWVRNITYTQTDTFTADGIWTVPSGVTSAIVELFAGGGGGTGSVGGGGGGAYSRSTLSVVAADNYSIQVSEGGAVGTNARDTIFGGMESLVVAGGGGGGRGGSSKGAGGGGAGGIKNEMFQPTVTSYSITVGSGGSGSGSTSANGANGGDSSIGSLIVATGGGGGASGGTSNGSAGGSGGGCVNGGSGGIGVPEQGYNGGGSAILAYGGGGGGRGENGYSGTVSEAGDGGNGQSYSITGSAVTYGGGGGGGGHSSTPSSYGSGGSGGGGNGSASGSAGSNGTDNLGGGGGGGSASTSTAGGSGGSGVVIIRYITGAFTATGGTITTSGNYTIHTFNSSGTFTVTSINSNYVLAKGGKSGANGGTGGLASAGVGTIKYSGGNGYLDATKGAGGGGAGDSGDGTAGGDTLGGQGGEGYGGSGGGKYNTQFFYGGSLYGGGGNTEGSNGYIGGRGEVRISYTITAQSDYANVVSRISGRDTSTSTHYFNVPTGTLPGELLIMVFGSSGNQTATLTGWTKLTETHGVFNDFTQSVFWKRATGDDESSPVVTTTSSATWFIYRIVNGDTPIGDDYVGSGASSPPELNTYKSNKYLWIAAGSGFLDDITNNNPTAPPINYKNFLTIGPKYPYNTSNLSAPRTYISERYLEAVSEDPGAFTGQVGNTDAGVTIAVPYLAQSYFTDLSMAITVEFPESSERLYMTTHQDVKFLNAENGIWQSLWMGVYGKDAMSSDYPHPMKLLEAGGVLFVGDENKLHTMTATGTTASDVQESRLLFPFNYYINWIAITKSAVFIGLANKLGDDQPSLICYYEPFTEITRIFTIKEGTTIGYEQDENCFIVDRAGQMRYYSGTDFKVFDYFPPYYNSEKMNLIHRNGIVVKDSIVRFLWEGQYPYGAGVWTYDDGRLYHRHSLVFDGTSLNSFGAVDPANVPWGGLFYSDYGYFSGAAITGDASATKQGIFSDFRRTGVTVAENNRSYFKTIKFTSQGVDTNWQRIYAKIDDRRAGIQNGTIILKQRYQNSAIGEGYTAPVFNGTWTDKTHFTCSTASFVSNVDNGLIAVGDEVIVRTGIGAGMLAHISAITGTTTKTVTITEGLDDITTGTFTFSVENWRIVANKGVTGKSSPWVQVKAEVRDYIDVEELQVGSTINRDNNE